MVLNDASVVAFFTWLAAPFVVYLSSVSVTKCKGLPLLHAKLHYFQFECLLSGLCCKLFYYILVSFNSWLFFFPCSLLMAFLLVVILIN